MKKIKYETWEEVEDNLCEAHAMCTVMLDGYQVENPTHTYIEMLRRKITKSLDALHEGVENDDRDD